MRGWGAPLRRSTRAPAARGPRSAGAPALAGGTLFAAALCVGCSPDAGTRGRVPCPTGEILTAAGCLPVPDRPFPTRDAGLPTSPDASAPDVDPGDTGPPDTGAPPVDAGVAPDSGPTALELGGRWALESKSLDVVASEALGIAEVTFTTLAAIDLTATGQQLRLRVEVCALESTPFQGYGTTYPEAAIAAIEVAELGAELSGLGAGASFATEARVQLLGWRALRDPATDNVPSEPTDRRVVDSDRDNSPGVTLIVSGQLEGRISVANRVVQSLSGTVLDAEHIEGRVSTQRAQNILEAMGPLLFGNVSIAQHPDPSRSTFRMRRLEVSSADGCPAILAAREELFP